MKQCFVATLAALASCVVLADVPGLEQIMADPDWIGNPPTDAFWSDTGDAVYYRQKRAGSTLEDTYRLSLADTVAEPLRAQYPASSNRTRVYHAARSQVAWLQDGEVFTRSLPAGAVRQLTRTASA